MSTLRVVVDEAGTRQFPNVSIETSLLVKYFKDKEAGFVATYADLNSLIGRDIRQRQAYGYFSSARRILLRDHDMVLETVRGTGIRIATDGEKVNASGRDVGSARRALRRASRKLTAADYKALTDEQKRDYNVKAAHIGALRLMAAPTAAKKIEKEGARDILPTAKVLELFQR